MNLGLKVDINELDAKVKSSFSKVREDLDSFKKDLESMKNEFLQLKQEIMAKIDELSKKIENKDLFFVSTGNEGVSAYDVQRRTTTYDAVQQRTPSLDQLKREIEEMFLSLTDREFSVFMAVYDLEKEIKDVNYSDVAKRLKIAPARIREHIGSLLRKNLPINKERYYNGKVSLSIKKEFKDLNLQDKLIKYRKNTGQKTLFDV